jgi:hypothetical protein
VVFNCVCKRSQVFNQPIRSRIQKGQEAVHDMEVAHTLFVECPYLASGRWDFRQAIKVFLSHADLGLHVDHDCSCRFAEHWSLSAMRSKQRMVLQTRWVWFEAVDTFGGCRQSWRLMWWEDWCLSMLTMDMIAFENAVLSLTMVLSWPLITEIT